MRLQKIQFAGLVNTGIYSVLSYVVLMAYAVAKVVRVERTDKKGKVWANPVPTEVIVPVITGVDKKGVSVQLAHLVQNEQPVLEGPVYTVPKKDCMNLVYINQNGRRRTMLVPTLLPEALEDALDMIASDEDMLPVDINPSMKGSNFTWTARERRSPEYDYLHFHKIVDSAPEDLGDEEVPKTSF